MDGAREFNDSSYRQFLSEEKLMGCSCTRCGTVFLPPRPICTGCYSREMEWVEMPDTGRLAAFTCITIGPPAMLAEGYNRKNPYSSGVVEVGDGVRVDARIEGIDPKNPETVNVGLSMRADYIHREKEGIRSTVLAFRPL